MVMISKVSIVDCVTRAVTENGTDFDVMASELGVPLITGNFLFSNGKVSLMSNKGETLLVCSPMQIEGDKQVLIHFAFGTENRRICHNMTINDFEKIVSNFQTILALARLEERKD